MAVFSPVSGLANQGQAVVIMMVQIKNVLSTATGLATLGAYNIFMWVYNLIDTIQLNRLFYILT